MHEASTVQLDSKDFSELANKLSDGSTRSAEKNADIRDQQKVQERKEAPNNKKYTFRKGEQSFELDDDFELEMMADKKPFKLTLKELKDRAAGDIAVKNRMHSLAEEKKRIQGTFKEFADLARNDPLAALEFISGKAKEADSEFEYNRYIEKLAEQAEKLGRMDEKDRKALELEKKLAKAEQDLSQKERQQSVVLRKQELLTDYPEIGDSEFSQMVDAVLNSEELLQGLEDENDVMDKVEELIQETLTQRDIMSVIRELNPSFLNDNKLIFTLSDQLRQNPDLDEEDMRDIIQALVTEERPIAARSQEREKDIRTLSQKQRNTVNMRQYKEQSASPYDILKQKILENKDKFSKTPIYMR